MFKKIAGAAVAITVMASTPCLGAERLYRIVSHVREAGEVRKKTGILRHISDGERESVMWQEIAESIWFPRPPVSMRGREAPFEFPLLINDQKLPGMGAIVYVSSLREILMPRGNAAEIVFTIKGRESAKPESMDLRAIEIDGEGVALVESESGEPLAARLKIVRRLLPSLWSLDEKEKPKADEVDVAWAVIP